MILTRGSCNFAFTRQPGGGRECASLTFCSSYRFSEAMYRFKLLNALY